VYMALWECRSGIVRASWRKIAYAMLVDYDCRIQQSAGICICRRVLSKLTIE